MEISHTIYVITALYHFSCVAACSRILQLDHQVTFSRIQNMQKGSICTTAMCSSKRQHTPCTYSRIVTAYDKWSV